MNLKKQKKSKFNIDKVLDDVKEEYYEILDEMIAEEKRKKKNVKQIKSLCYFSNSID